MRIIRRKLCKFKLSMLLFSTSGARTRYLYLTYLWRVQKKWLDVRFIIELYTFHRVHQTCSLFGIGLSNDCHTRIQGVLYTRIAKVWRQFFFCTDSARVKSSYLRATSCIVKARARLYIPTERIDYILCYILLLGISHSFVCYGYVPHVPVHSPAAYKYNNNIVPV